MPPALRPWPLRLRPARLAGVLGGLLLCAVLATAAGASGAEPGRIARTVVHLLDYVAVDYPEFVRDGTVVDQAEYEEQLEFAAQSIALLEQLPANERQPALLASARELHRAVAGKAAGPVVADAANALRAAVIDAYRLTVAPERAPDPEEGSRLYEERCASCHGPTGRGDGPLAAGMEPTPSNFHDPARMQARSLYGLYNTVTLGVAGTPMRAFGELSEAQRWNLTFHLARLRSTPAEQAEGESLWRRGIGKAELGSLRALVSAAPGELVRQHGPALASVHGWLTAHPDAIGTPSPLQATRSRLQQSLHAYRNGDRAAARNAAIEAYLEGFELVESSLDNVDPALRVETEREMMALRAAIASAEPLDRISSRFGRIDGLLDRAERRLSPGEMAPATAFVASLLILVREGLEAILVLAAIIAVVVRTGRRDALRYIHLGWISAVVLGVLTWIAARSLLAVSGANRELTEGITALIAAAMLLYVGYWLHGKSYARAWQRFIREQIGEALAKRTMWAMALVSFLAVYRELFETILFYQALWVQAGSDGHPAVLGGIGAASVLLALIGTAIFRYGVRLPIGPFFGATSLLLVLLALVFAGHGIAALQEAGVVDASAVRFVSIPLLGIYPTVQGLLVQFAALALALASALLARRQAARS